MKSGTANVFQIPLATVQLHYWIWGKLGKYSYSVYLIPSAQDKDIKLDISIFFFFLDHEVPIARLTHKLLFRIDEEKHL